MLRLAPLVIRLTAVSLVALVIAEPGNGGDQSVARAGQGTPASLPATAQPPPRRSGKRERNRKRTTTTTTTTVDPNDDDEDDITTSVTTTTIDPRALDHSKYLAYISRVRVWICRIVWGLTGTDKTTVSKLNAYGFPLMPLTIMSQCPIRLCYSRYRQSKA